MGKGKGGYVPLDESLSLPEGQYSYAVQEQMSLYATEDGFDESAKKLRHSFPVEASGSIVESACRHVVGDRLKRSGMRWTTQGAQYITLLRLKWKNDAWKDYWGRYRSCLAA